MNVEFIWTKDFGDFSSNIIGNKQALKALGIREIKISDCDEWLLTIVDGELAGFSGYKLIGKKTTLLKRSFVFEKYRKQNIYTKMIDLRIEKAKELGRKIIECTTTKMSKLEFEKRGFKLTKQYKNFQTFKLEL